LGKIHSLSWHPYRDSSFDYYISEEMVDNDPRGSGPFIWASMEYERYNGNQPDLSD
jgi:unsaturated rhamnogalacturonyl hydrolase